MITKEMVMKRIASLLVLVNLIAVIAGCDRNMYPELPDNPKAFEMGEYIDKTDDDAGYATIEYNGRTYMPYGTIGKTMHRKDIDECIGFLVQDGEKMTDFRVFTLTDDPDHNYLMDYYVKDTEMNQPNFWRAVDTKGKEIKTPEFINSLDYSYWN